jgi:subtilisin family serine protease
LKSEIIAGKNYMLPGASVDDMDGHGTRVACVASAITNNGKGVASISWNSKLYILAAADNGFLVAEAIADAASKGLKIINVSQAIKIDKNNTDPRKEVTKAALWVLDAIALKFSRSDSYLVV